MKFIWQIFDENHNHPSYKPGNPNRAIPIKIRKKLILYNPILWFGTVWFLFTFWFSLSTITKIDFKVLFWDSDNALTTKAKIVNVESTHYGENDISIYKYTYEYTVNNKGYKGASYDAYQGLTVDSITVVEYQNGSPLDSKIKGMKSAPASFWVIVIVVIFPFLGLGLIYVGLKSSYNLIMRLKHGIVTEAIIVDSKVNKEEDQETFDIYVTFMTIEGKEIKTKINISDQKKARVGKNAPIIYLPWDPYDALFYKSLDYEKRMLVENG